MNLNLRHRMRAANELWLRYRRTFGYFWQQRKALTPPSLEPEEAEFLPAVLSLQMAPVSPAGRWVARLLTLLLGGTLLWATLGEIDIVVTGGGRVIPSERTKTIAAVEVASVRALHVTEGQSVRVGDLLVELDAREREAERAKADVDREAAELIAARSRALLDAMSGRGEPRLPPLASVSPDRWHEAARHLTDQWRDFVARADRLDREIQRFETALRLATQRSQDYAVLARTRDVSEHAWLEKEQQRVELEGQLNDARAQRAALVAETRKIARDALSEAMRSVAGASQDVQRAAVRGDLLRLVSPIDGVVQQLNVHTVGAAVPAAQPLMQIVPSTSTVEVEALIENKDVGFVKVGQDAAVKIEAFPYTKYGLVRAKVIHISQDAINDEKRGLVYSVKVQLLSASMSIDGTTKPLTPGMICQVEIRTGSRRLMDYFLSPLITSVDESLHER